MSRSAPFSHHAYAPRPARLRDRSGIIVLGPLVALVVLLVVMVVAGKVLYPAPRGTYVTPAAPELHYAASPADVYSGNRLALRVRPGDPVWIVRLDNGAAVVFRDGTGREVVGVTPALVGSARRATRRAPRG